MYACTAEIKIVRKELLIMHTMSAIPKCEIRSLNVVNYYFVDCKYETVLMILKDN